MAQMLEWQDGVNYETNSLEYYGLSYALQTVAEGGMACGNGGYYMT